MSDLFYPKAILQHDQLILEFVDCLRYDSYPGHRFAFIYAMDKGKNGKFSDLRPHAKIPGEYFLHVRRLLWRYYLFTVFLKLKGKLRLAKSFVLFLQKMVVMFDTILEQLVYPCFQLPDRELEVNQRFPLFDLYLSTEFVVGYHDPKSVDVWRKRAGNTTKDLERMDPFQFDWNAYDNALGDLLSGEMCQYDVDGDEMTRELIDKLLTAVGQWYDMPTRRSTKRKRRSQAAEQTPRLVNGSPGLGELIMDYDEPIRKGYDTSDELSDAEWEKDVANANKQNVVKSAPVPVHKKAAKQKPNAKSRKAEPQKVKPKTAERTKAKSQKVSNITAETSPTASTSRIPPWLSDSQPPPPNQLELVLHRQADPGSQLLGCAKLIGTGNIE
ncbi:hypothetical protein JVU11DRAFT_11557 [Chiua virens]|nr:hypothetical protein JVU11DRAFT_11557 [Chiua virens]